MNVVELIAKEEGFRSKPYQCSEGVWTIGHGITQMTEEESLAVIQIKLEKIADKLRAKYSWYHQLSATRQAVVQSMAYQLGMNGLSKFKNMLSALENGDWKEAAKQSLDSKYARQTPNRANRQADLLINS